MYPSRTSQNYETMELWDMGSLIDIQIIFNGSIYMGIQEN
jgi:hypothetical protein